MQVQTRQSIEEYPLQVGQGVWQGCLHQLVLGYLVHHGYCNTAASFAATTSQILHEDLSSIKNRQSKLVSFDRHLVMRCEIRNTRLSITGPNHSSPPVSAISLPWNTGE